MLKGNSISGNSFEFCVVVHSRALLSSNTSTM